MPSDFFKLPLIYKHWVTVKNARAWIAAPFSYVATTNGEGVYFAVNAGYSASDTYSRPDAQGLKRMYLCNVLTGEYTVGQAGMRVPPTKAGQQAHILYDSVVNNTASLGMFIIFNDTQAYPAYLITFK